MNRSTLFTTVTTWAVLAAVTSPASGGIPLPDAVLYSEAAIDGLAVDATDHVTILARYEGNVVARYNMGDRPQAGDKFILRIPVESLADGSSPNPKAIRLGDTVEIFAVQNSICIGGENDGEPCEAANDCVEGSCGDVESLLTTTCIEDQGSNTNLDLLCELAVYGDVRPPFAVDTTATQPDLDDLICVMDAFTAGPAWATTCPLADLLTELGTPTCAPDGSINLDDILAALEAFGRNPVCPALCA